MLVLPSEFFKKLFKMKIITLEKTTNHIHFISQLILELIFEIKSNAKIY